jgi:hypothetical protein
VGCKNVIFAFFEKSVLKNVVFRPAGDNILVERRIPPETKVPPGTSCEEENIFSPAGEGVKGWCFFYRYNVLDKTKKDEYFLKY